MGANRDRVLSTLSLAAKAGKAKSGEFQTEEAIKNNSARFVLVAKDASENTKKKFRDLCAYTGVPYGEYADRESLGHCVGKDFRASVAITEESFAGLLERELQNVSGKDEENIRRWPNR